MNVLHVLFFGFISAELCGLNAAVEPFTGVEGRGITVRCHFSLCTGKVVFCKTTCERDENVLIETTTDTVHKGRYSIEHQGTSQSCAVFITIKQLIRSDAGRYTCYMSNWFASNQQEIDLTVKAAPTTTASTGSVSPESLGESTTQAADYFLPLVLSVSLVVLLAAVLLLIYKKKTRRNVDGLNTGVNLEDQNGKVGSYEDCSVPRHEDSLYQSLSPASRDQDQIYCTITKHI
ncbi:uncharacterized protein LOC125004409 [Mugil cephalus]|uniref:uncharacterized protein LOC125004409 n=1 Tax=Mugil cephalus TaxID=48193 RepID=UPI001FB7D43D|nr:uncharacterized protein LOC125004409 [Mugil cephalus]